MERTFLFYDLETSGINKCFDQVFQFAAIRTDLELNELERHEMLIKLNPDTIPDPRATITHHLSINYLNENGICEYEAIKQIHRLINHPGTISIGYNTLGFDDEFLRFSFHRNLFTPYSHQYANRCSRMDIYPLIPVYCLFANDVLKWPKVDGKFSFKLDNLNIENKLFEGGRAHDAMVDIEVTIALAKKLKSKQKIWDYLLQNYSKQTEQERFLNYKGGLTIDGSQYHQAIMVSGIIGKDNLFHAPVLHLGQHYSYKNQDCFIRLDLAELREVNQENIEEKIWGIKKKWGEPPFILPANKQYAAYLTPERLQEVKLNKDWIERNTKEFLRLKDYILSYKYPEHESVDSDADLYQSAFPSNNELRLLDAYHQKSFQEKFQLLDQLSESIKKRALRQLARNAINILPEPEQVCFQNYLEQVSSFDKNDLPIDFKGNTRRSIDQVFEDIQSLRENDLTDEQLTLLNELEEYIS
jgi:exodeoxyribonuclease-1